MVDLTRLLPVFRKQEPGKAVATVSDDEPLPLAVLEFQSPTAAVIATPFPPMARWTNYFVTALVFSVVLIACFVKTDKIVTSTGVVASQAPDYSIQAFNSSSIVESINVSTGQVVKKGQLLATLNPTYAAADLTSLTQQEQSYAAQVAQLQAQEDGKPYMPDSSNPASILQTQTYNQQMGQYNFTMQDYAQKIASLKEQIEGYESQADYYKSRLSIAQNVETMRKDLQKLQVGSKLDTLAATDDRINLQAELSNAVSSAAAAKKQLASQEAERDSFDQQWKSNISQQLATAQNNLYQAQQSLAKAKLDNQLVSLTAPRDSIVKTVADLGPGSVLQAGQTILQLSPLDAPLEIDADIDASESGFVQPGDSVVIKFQTLDYNEFGDAKGTVVSISPESFNPLDQQAVATNGAPLPGGPQNLYYKAKVSIDVLNLHNVPKGFQVVPGMPVEADMKVGKQTVMEYFVRKLMPIAYESMREP